MQTIASNSQNTIQLEIFVDGVLTQADSVPTLSIYDADNDSTPITGYENVSATDDPPAGKYSYLLTPNITSVNRVLEVRWSYHLNSIPVTQTDFYSIETPYSTISDAIDFLGYGSTPEEINYKDPKDIVAAEKIARTIIEGYTGIKFYTYYGQQEVFGKGADAVELTEKILRIDQVYENDILIIDNTISPVFNTFGFTLEISPTGRQVRIYYPGWDLRYDNQIDPTVLYYGRFRDNARYVFQGQMGYKYVPQDIKLASLLLVNDIVSNDFNWRNKYLKKIDLSEISFEMAGGAFNGTGNVTVDNILDQYRNMNIVII